jgi:hypothetical protein
LISKSDGVYFVKIPARKESDPIEDIGKGGSLLDDGKGGFRGFHVCTEIIGTYAEGIIQPEYLP